MTDENTAPRTGAGTGRRDGGEELAALLTGRVHVRTLTAEQRRRLLRNVRTARKGAAAPQRRDQS